MSQMETVVWEGLNIQKEWVWERRKKPWSWKKLWENLICFQDQKEKQKLKNKIGKKTHSMYIKK